MIYRCFGGRISDSRDLEDVEPALGRSWIGAIKRRERAAGHYLETADGAFIACSGQLAPDPRPDIIRKLNRSTIIG